MKIDKVIIEVEGHKQQISASPVLHLFSGFAADEINMEVTLTSAKDIDKYIKILECAKPCFKDYNRQP